MVDEDKQAVIARKGAMQMARRIFWNDGQKRLRAGWRMLAQLLIAGVLVMAATAIWSLVSEWILNSALAESLAVRLVVRLVKVNITWLCLVASLALAGRFLDRRPLRDFGFALDRNWWLDLGFGLLLGAGLMAAIFGVEYALGWVEIRATLQTNSNTFGIGIILYIGMFLGVAMEEEIMARGYWLRNLAEGFTGRWLKPRGALLLAYAISSAIFGLLHLGNENASLVSTLNLVMAGLMLGLPYVLTGELAIPIGLHMTWNFFQGNVFGFPVSGGAPGTTFIAIQQGGADLWTGGAFGPEAGLVGVLAMLLGTGAIVLWVRLRRGRVTFESRLADYREESANYI
ncbi:MAG TPA: type II CAAX endopeptidase family protein [Anaerolineaceae bacterium]|nr:type II CAAX endopeptidase family protein [Anaerolineaceae bacterium]HPN50878.1 type II CAAX endopeptidase family protein [Anaerolineaceae bacterium]